MDVAPFGEQYRTQYKLYRLSFHPDIGMALDERNDKGEWLVS